MESIISVDVTVDTVNIEAVKIEDIEKVEDSSLLFSLFQSQRELSRVSSTVYMSGGSMTKLKAHESLAEITTQPQTNSDDTVKIEEVKIEDIEKVEDYKGNSTQEDKICPNSLHLPLLVFSFKYNIFSHYYGNLNCWNSFSNYKKNLFLPFYLFTTFYRSYT